MPTLLTSWYGSFLLDDEGHVKEQALFPKDARELGRVLLALDGGAVLDEERAIAPKEPFTVVEDRLLVLEGATRARGDVELDAHDVMRQVAASGGEFGFDRALLRDATLALGRSKVQQAYQSRDLHIVQAVDAIDEQAAQVNVLMERLREWYGLHWPEVLDRVPDNEELAKLVAEHGSRDALRAAKPELDAPSEMGGPLTESDEASIKSLARGAAALFESRRLLEKYLDEEMPKIAPSTARVAGPVLAARLIRHARGLKRLATMPAGTIQTLGAEKALFRHIKEGKRPPKHGVIFNHPTLHRAPRHQRGPLARALAGKIALAARADAFTRHDIGVGLVDDFDKRAERIRVEHALPSKRVGRPGPGAPRGGPREGFRPRGPPREGGFRPRGPPPREGGFRGPPRGPPRDSRGPPRGPPRDARGPPPRGPPRDARGPPRGPPGSGGYDFRRPPTRGDFERRPKKDFGKKDFGKGGGKGFKGKKDRRGGDR